MAEARNRTQSTPDAQGAATAPLSPAAAAVAQVLSQWRTRISETQTLLRLTLSLLQSAEAMSDERREQLGRLMAVEERVLAQLPSPEFAQLRSTTNARESGIDLRGPDTSAAELHLVRTRERIGAQVAGLAAALPRAGIESALAAMVAIVQRSLEDLGRSIELISTALYPRVTNPTVALGDAIERAAAPRNQAVTLDGLVAEPVQQVRGLMRFLSELIGAVGDNAFVHIAREGGWIYATFAPLATAGASDGDDERSLGYAREQLLRLAGYLLRINAERLDGGGWRVTFVGQ